MKKIGLALGGGGARGFAHIAFIKALDEMNIKPSVISGTSMGAIIGAYYAAGTSGAQMEKYLENLGLLKIGKMVDFSIHKSTAILKGKKIEKFFYETIPARWFHELKIPLKIVATDFWKRKEFLLESGELIPAIRASMSLPAIFEPVKIRDTVMIDGGAVDPLPYDIIRNECDILIAIDVSGTKIPRPYNPMPSMFESIMSTFEIMMTSIIEQKSKTTQPDIYVKPELKNIQILDFHRAEEILDSVRNDVERFKFELARKLKKRFLFFNYS